MGSAKRMLVAWRRRLTAHDRHHRALTALSAAPPSEVAPMQRRLLDIIADALDATVRLVPPHVLPDLSAQSTAPLHLQDSLYGGPAIAVPLRGAGTELGILVASRPPGDQFTGEDLTLFSECAARVAALLGRSFRGDESTALAVLEERSRLAREIHDGLAQHIAFLKMRIAWLRRAPDAVDDGELAGIESMLDTALAEARHAISTLRADRLGRSTSETLRVYAAEFARSSDLDVTCDVAPFCPEVSPTARLELLRIVQESLNNVRKHAQATRVEVEIWPRDDGLEVSLRDNGRGFDPAAGKAGHFGLDIMRERAESVGGSLTISTQPGKGTAVSVWVPSADVPMTAPDSLNR